MFSRPTLPSRVAAAMILIAAIATVTVMFFIKSMHADYACYGLPAANWVTGKGLTTPQQGTQFGLDHLWRFNSPLLGAGPAACFLVGGISPDVFLAGCILCGLVAIWTFVRLTFLALPGHHVLAAGTAAAFLTVGVYLSEAGNHRLTILCPAAIAVLYYPFVRSNGQAPWFQWAIAGSLPLLHPAVLPASVVFVLAESLAALPRRRLPFSLGAALLFLAGVAASGAWYLDPEGLRTQFLPHLVSREFRPFSGWNQPNTWKYALPSQMTMALVPLSLGIALGTSGSSENRRSLYRAVALAGVAMSLDATGRMFYLSYYLIGLGPTAVFHLAHSRFGRPVCRMWCVLAALQIAIAIKMMPGTLVAPRSRAELHEFLVTHTRPDDVIVVGPPFILNAASDANPGENRRIAHVVPMPLYLSDFDVNAWLREIQGSATVYVGEPVYFTAAQLYYRPTSPPIFPHAHLETVRFHGHEILIARPTVKEK